MPGFEEYEEAVTGITSGYAFADGVTPRVPYSYMGAIYDEEERSLLLSVLDQEALTMGPQVGAFEREFAEWCGAGHAFATTSCTTAMHVAAQALGIGPGDEVIVTPNTFVATTLVILKEGGIPIYADIDPRTYNIDPAEIAKKITSKTKAIFVVHYAGLMCDMDPIMELAGEHGLAVLEDCAHAHGAEYKGRRAGTIGDVGCFSFHSLKNMTMGEGGMITTSRDDLIEPISLLRNMNITEWHEKPKEYWLPSHFDVKDWNGKWGVNYRMTEFQAAVGRAQLRKIGEMVRLRRQHSHYLSEGLQGVQGYVTPFEPEGSRHAYHLYTLCVEPELLNRDEVMRDIYCRQQCTQGILHYQPTYDLTGVQQYLEDRGYGGQFCPNADAFFYRREFNLPMHPRLTREQLDIMIEGLLAAADRAA
jgi:perosamine synthetase